MTRSHDIPVVDSHHHLWDLGSHAYPWLRPGVSSIVGDTTGIRRNYLAQDYRHDTRAFNVVGSVHLDGGFDPSDPVGETCFVQGIADVEGFPSAIIGHVRLDALDALAVIEAHVAASPLVRGVRHIVAWHRDRRLSYVERPDLLTDPRWVANYRKLARFGLSFDMQIYPSQMADAARLAAETPDVLMIINQAGMPDGLMTGDLSDWKAGIRLLSRQPNVAIKISGLGMLVPSWTEAEAYPIVQHALEAFGDERIISAQTFRSTVSSVASTASSRRSSNVRKRWVPENAIAFSRATPAVFTGSTTQETTDRGRHADTAPQECSDSRRRCWEVAHRT